MCCGSRYHDSFVQEPLWLQLPVAENKRASNDTQKKKKIIIFNKNNFSTSTENQYPPSYCSRIFVLAVVWVVVHESRYRAVNKYLIMMIVIFRSKEVGLDAKHLNFRQLTDSKHIIRNSQYYRKTSMIIQIFRNYIKIWELSLLIVCVFFFFLFLYILWYLFQIYQIFNK